MMLSLNFMFDSNTTLKFWFRR